MTTRRISVQELLFVVFVVSLSIGMILAASAVVAHKSGPDLESNFENGAAVFESRGLHEKAAEWRRLAAGQRLERNRGIDGIHTLLWVIGIGITAYAVRIAIYVARKCSKFLVESGSLCRVDRVMAAIANAVAMSAIITLASYLGMLILAAMTSD